MARGSVLSRVGMTDAPARKTTHRVVSTTAASPRARCGRGPEDGLKPPSSSVRRSAVSAVETCRTPWVRGGTSSAPRFGKAFLLSSWRSHPLSAARTADTKIPRLRAEPGDPRRSNSHCAQRQMPVNPPPGFDPRPAAGTPWRACGNTRCSPSRARPDPGRASDPRGRREYLPWTGCSD